NKPGNSRVTKDQGPRTKMRRNCLSITILVGFLAIAAGFASSQDSGGAPPQQPAAKAARDEPPPRPAARPAGQPKVAARPGEIRKRYQFSLGPWPGEFSVPESIDLLDIADRIRGVLGILAILGVAVFLSDNRRAISGRVIFWGLVLQWGFALLVLRLPAGVEALEQAGEGGKAIPDCALAG